MLDRFTGRPENKAALTSRVPLGRVAAPEEIARAIVFVASQAASFMAGQIVTVDGGKTAGRTRLDGRAIRSIRPWLQ